jgi:hypothetical protein
MNLQDTKRHEQIHNLTDIGIRTFSNRNRILRTTSRIRQLQESHISEIVIQFELDKLYDLTEPKHLIDQAHYEMLGALEYAERVNFFYQSPRSSSSHENPFRSMEHFRGYCDAFETAGKDVHDVIRQIFETVNLDLEEVEQEKIQRLTAQAGHIASLFVRSVDALRKSLQTTEALTDGHAYRDWIHSACLVLRPTQFVHLPALLRRSVGNDDLVDEAEIKVADIFNLTEKLHSPELLSALEELVKKYPTDRLVRDLVESLLEKESDEIEPESLEPYHITTRGDSREFLRRALTIAQTFPTILKVHSSLQSFIFFQLVERDIPIKNSKLKQLKETCQGTEKESFDEAFRLSMDLEDFSSGLIEYAEENNLTKEQLIGEIDRPFVEEQGYWDELIDQINRDWQE